MMSSFDRLIIMYAFMDGMTPERAKKRLEDYREYEKQVNKIKLTKEVSSK